MPSINKTVQQYYLRAKGVPVELALSRYRRQLGRIDEYREQMADATDLRRCSKKIAARAKDETPLDSLLPEAFALVREAAHRTIGLRAFDVQLIGAIALQQGKVAQLDTGEGKTLIAVFAAYLDALLARGVHVLTFNDYLARRDAMWMGPVYEALGLSVGVVQEGTGLTARRRAWAADVTYATARECGFDYLRDGLRADPADVVQRPPHFAIIDEADSILIDEARIPLVLAGNTHPPDAPPARLTAVVRQLEPNRDHHTDENDRNVFLTGRGIDRVEVLLGCGPLHDPPNVPLLAAVNQALHAEVLLRRDVDYIVRDGKVGLIDEFTGRVAEDRRWPDGLQAALEAKEGLEPHSEGVVLSSIALQHFLRLYPKLAGMTATARTAAEELGATYGLSSVIVPPNRPCVRVDHPDEVFTHSEAKNAALSEEIERVHATGRPILVGTVSVAESEHLAAQLQRAGVDCSVLNARNDEQEAAIVARAGRLGEVTISTNMAGRGTDIRLGGADDPSEHDRVVELGGLYVIGTNRHESVRVDDQLRGRAGRQGDPGSSRFFICLEDDLLRRFGVEELIGRKHLPPRQDGPITDRVVRREVARAQRIVEDQNFQIRRTLFRYSTIVENQRQQIAQRRRAALQENSGLLAQCAPKRFESLCNEYGEPLLQQVERQITLAALDRLWADHLATVADIREGIHLHGLSGNNPFHAGQEPLIQFHRKVSAAFRDAWDGLDDRVVEAFRTTRISSQGADLADVGLDTPSATWTYIINDDPFGDVLTRMGRRLRQALDRS